MAIFNQSDGWPPVVQQVVVQALEVDISSTFPRTEAATEWIRMMMLPYRLGGHSCDGAFVKSTSLSEATSR